MKFHNAPKRYYRIYIALIAFAALLASSMMVGKPIYADKGGIPQASLTLTNCDAAFCYTHNNNWTLTKQVTGSNVTGGTGSVTWTIMATQSDGGTTFSVKGGLTIANTGTAPATIGNIVVNLQKPNSPKKASNAPYVSVAADIANATQGDAATSANIVAAGSQENVATNAAWGTNNYTVSGAKGTFVETAGSGSLEFTDASNNSIFSLVPQPVIPAGDSVTLLYTASFNTSILSAGTAYRVEALVTFGNAGGRGGSGASATSIDIDGNGSVSPDEANVRTVPCRDTLDPLPATPTECNGSVTVTDNGPTPSGTLTIANPVGFDQFPAIINMNTTWTVSVDIALGTEGGEVCNTAELNGEACGGTLGVVVGYTPDQFDEYGNNIGHQPIFATYECAPAAHDEDADCFSAGRPDCLDCCTDCELDFCSYTQGKFQSSANNPVANYLQANFSSLFPNGLTIGIADGAGPKHNATWTTATSFRTWIGGGGPSGALTGDTLNATSTSGGTLAKQAGALTVNLALSGVMSGDPTGLGNLTVCHLTAGTQIGSWTLTQAQADALNGKTISQILTDANNALGGNGLPSYAGSFSDLNQLLTALNESFDDCDANGFATSHICQ